MTHACLHTPMSVVAVTTGQGNVVLGIATSLQNDGRWIVGCEDNAVRFRFDWQLQFVQQAGEPRIMP